jgi:hypothetical protein
VERNSVLLDEGGIKTTKNERYHGKHVVYDSIRVSSDRSSRFISGVDSAADDPSTDTYGSEARTWAR